MKYSHYNREMRGMTMYRKVELRVLGRTLTYERDRVAGTRTLRTSKQD